MPAFTPFALTLRNERTLASSSPGTELLVEQAQRLARDGGQRVVVVARVARNEYAWQGGAPETSLKSTTSSSRGLPSERWRNSRSMSMTSSRTALAADVPRLEAL
jgi:hypothetical protein